MSVKLKTSSSTQVLDEKAVIAAMERSLAMIEFDTEGNVLWANDNFARAMGYSAAEMPGLKHRQFCSPEYVNSAEYVALWNALRSGRPFQEKIMRISKDGRLLWFEATYTPVCDEEGRVRGILKVATDITARENAAANMTSELQRMAAELLRRAEGGISSSREIHSAIERVVQESHDNMRVLQVLEREANSVRGLVKTIRDIAAQTNLLALNAAIEAAHAGEHGRGFNVVAGEVRKLAKQVDDATKQAHSNLEGIAGKVEEIAVATKRSQTTISDSRLRIQQAVEQFTGIGQAANQLDRQAQSLGDML